MTATSSHHCNGDHPRVCGEHPLVYAQRSEIPGSSPRMRGTPVRLEWIRGENGIIPAYAGNTSTTRLPLRKHWDHPRVCGEHAVSASDSIMQTGSSPRMRGTQDLSMYCVPFSGIIPAYAGNTTEPVPLENASQGSSPRMRGTLWPSYCGLSSNGIIPAYAGNTHYGHCHIVFIGDHPRVCGEHVSACGDSFVHLGSSPRMRGTPAQGTSSTSTAGIIPAYAGNTFEYPCQFSFLWDHPRVCGEH